MTALLVSFVLAASSAPRYGTLDFPVTGNAECRRLFVQGMLQLHSFQYEDAHETFQAAGKADPGCAMAFWGDAMTYSHPIWGEEQVQSARAALAKVKDTSRLRPTERAHLAAAQARETSRSDTAPGSRRPTAPTGPSPRTTSWRSSTRWH